MRVLLLLLLLVPGIISPRAPSLLAGPGSLVEQPSIKESADTPRSQEKGTGKERRHGKDLPPQILVIQVVGPINPILASFIERQIKRGEEEGAACLVIEMDTPGGLDKSMRDIIQQMLNTRLPVVVYVYPPGARAASAGLFLTMAAHVAAMAPGTNIGAAHPVNLGGGEEKEGKEPSTMMKKVTNDAAAFIRTIAEKTGRNPVWAEKAVRESVSATEKEALKLRIIDLIARDLDDLLNQIDGREVKTLAGTVTLHTRGLPLKRLKMSWIEHFLFTISEPNIAYVLFILGIYGLIYEFASPGAVLPGIVGTICLLLFFYAVGTLPINYTGLFLILLGITLFVMEVKIPSHGILTLGGLIAFVLGSMILVESGPLYYSISKGLIFSTASFTAVLFFWWLKKVVEARRRPPTTSQEGLIGKIGVARTPLSPSGTVFVFGALWQAESLEGTIGEGEKILVTAVQELTLKVKRAPS